MREILFRGKSYTDSKWHYGYFFRRFSTPFSPERYEITDGAGLGWNCPAETIGQFTGLTDKNGKKIFEGDIVRYQFDNNDSPFPNKHTEKIIGKIFFSDFRASFSITAGKNGSDMLNNDLFRYVQNGNRVEIIGNVHDNAHAMTAPEGSEP